MSVNFADLHRRVADLHRHVADLHRRVVFGQSNGRIIWQPRIGCWYTDKQSAGEPLPPPFTGMTPAQIYRELNCSARIYEYNACFRAVEHPSVQGSSRWLNETDEAITVTTPAACSGISPAG